MTTAARWVVHFGDRNSCTTVSQRVENGGMISSQFLLSGIIKLDCKPTAVLLRLAPTVCDSVSFLRSGTVSMTVLELS